ncbi:MAG: hypothetical protein JF597_17950 [Streptomyces sp.]|uniref:hypothetical protein n=1 Tax=Streptomyces sp. TaxID=1931 RepID=UPI0025E77A16|nr:hypothetical protein [Streptomyces sp.]MBW8795408.1 hypothetical protein [Streptomyces sp.]
MCLIKKVLDKKILVPLAITVAGTLSFPPSWDLVAVPLLVMLVCPLTVLVMMRDRPADAGASVTDAAAGESDPTMLTDEAIEARIRALQAELRHLKGTQAHRAEEAATAHGSRNPGGPDEPGPPAPSP